MRKLQIYLAIILMLLAVQVGYTYSMATVNKSTACNDQEFREDISLNWQILTTAYTNIYGYSSTNITYHGHAAMFLEANYTTTNSSYEAAVSPLYPIELYGTPRDSVLIKVRFMGMDSLSACTVTGLFSVEVKGGLSVSTTSTGFLNANDSTADNRIFQRAFIQSWASDSVIGVFTTWNVLSFTFTPPSCDWWQIRQLKLSYQAAPNQTGKTGIAVDNVEIYAIRIDP